MTFETIRKIISLPFYDKMNVAELWLYRLKGWVFYRRVFKSFGKKSAIYPPTLIGRPMFIHIGDRVTIREGVRLEAILLDPNTPPEIRIGNDVRLEEDVCIATVGKIYIHDNVCIAARSALLGTGHPFYDVKSPVKIGDRVEGEKCVIEIGEGSFLGLGSVIQMNVKLGKHVVVGSHSVVRRSVPDYCVVDGHPAAVVLAYDVEKDRWARPPRRS
jgi:acetyltransferase-like isoleucine patch superfamily enzyme